MNLSSVTAILILSMALIPTQGSGAVLISTLGQPLDAFNGFNTGDYQATDFITGAFSTIVTSATANLYNADNRDHTLTAVIFANGPGNLPGSVVGTFDSDFFLPADIVSGDISNASNFSAATAGILLAPNTRYWIGLRLNDPRQVNTVHWTETRTDTYNTVDAGSIFNYLADTEHMALSLSGGSSWTYGGNNGDYRYSLSGIVVPEPQRAVLTGLGLIALLLRRSRRTQTPFLQPRANKTDAGNGSYSICRAIDTSSRSRRIRSVSPRKHSRCPMRSSSDSRSKDFPTVKLLPD